MPSNGIDFLRADVLGKELYGREGDTALPVMDALRHHSTQKGDLTKWDILISNPPYISPQAFQTTTMRSVRNYEPKLALVPDRMPDDPGVDSGDVFYPRLLDIAKQVDAKIVLFEVADMEQARRVAIMAVQRGLWDGIEIWKDWPTSEGDYEHELERDEELGDISIRGHGNGRSVFAWRDEARQWLKS